MYCFEWQIKEIHYFRGKVRARRGGKGSSRTGCVRHGGDLPAVCCLSAVICLYQRVNPHTRGSELSRAQLSALSYDRQQDSEMPRHRSNTTHTQMRFTPDAVGRQMRHPRTCFNIFCNCGKTFNRVKCAFMNRKL